MLSLAACGTGSPSGSDSAAQPAAPDAGAVDAAPTDPYRAAVLADRPVVYLPLDEAAGATRVRDQASGRFLDVKDCVLGAPGERATSLEVDGARSVIDLGDVFVASGRTTFTFEAWVRLRARPAVSGAVIAQLAGAHGYAIRLSAAGRWTFERHAGTRMTVVDANVEFFHGPRFHHLVASYDGSTLRFYYDGALAAEAADDAEVAAGSPLRIGAESPGVSHYDGWIDEVAVYDEALDTSAVARHFAAARP